MSKLFYNDDCFKVMKKMDNDSVNLTLTDIPYGVVNRSDNGLRNLNKGKADELNFDVGNLLGEVLRVTSGTIIIFCSKEQISDIYKFFVGKKGTVRHGVWVKSNPMPSNGQYVYLSGIENFVWFKKPKSTFNAHCKNPVFTFPNGSSKIHPTEKNHKLLEDLILDNSNIGDTVFDPCAGSGSTLLVANKLKRNFLGVELNKGYYEKAINRLMEEGVLE